MRFGSPDGADARFMEQVLALAALAEGTVSPNPRVGCLVVRDGRVIGRGFHRAPGRRHAEAMALDRAGAEAEGATLYVNLEPCAHHGRTPPCARRIVEHGIRRVVASIQDPNPLVNGTGFRALREAGIEVEVGALERDARRLNAPFLHWHAHHEPLVTLKAALSADGLLSAAGGESRWITGSAARRFAHRLRHRHDAILVGAGTVRRDDPRLTVRLPGGGSRPILRVVLAPGLDVDPGANVFRDPGDGSPPTRVYVSSDLPGDARERFVGVADVVGVPHGEQGLDLRAVLRDLGRAGIQSVIVEGGGRTHAGFVAAGLARFGAIFVSPRLLGGRGGTPLLDLESVTSPDRGWWLEDVGRLALGPDVLLTGTIEGPGGGTGPDGERRCSQD